MNYKHGNVTINNRTPWSPVLHTLRELPLLNKQEKEVPFKNFQVQTMLVT